MDRLIVYVGFSQPDEWSGWAATYARHAKRFEEAAGGTLCLIVPFDRVTPALMARLEPRAVVLSGFGRSFEQYPIESFHGVADWLDVSMTPTLALCGSHQLLGFHYHRPLRERDRLADEPMRRLHPGELATNPDYHPDFFMERGFYPIEIIDAGRADPLFEGFGSTAWLLESHYCEVKTLPPDFVLLASTAECRIQAMRHRSRPLYGIQSHPEDYSDRFPDGRRLLDNFFSSPG